MESTAGELEARLEALAQRVDAALSRARETIEPPDRAEQRALVERLRAAEANVTLQAQRAQSLEERVTDLDAALAHARTQRAEALAEADAAQRRADQALEQLQEQLEEQRLSHGDSVEAKLTATLQSNLLELERLTSELTGLRRSNEEWRTRARTYKRDLDRITAEHERASTQLADLRSRDSASSKRLAELDRLVTEQRRELEIAERRAKHLREHMAVRGA